MKSMLANFFAIVFLLASSPLVAALNVATLDGSNRITSKNQAAQIIQNRFGGKLLQVSQIKVGKNEAFRVKVVADNGKISIYIVDAKTGKIRKR